MIGESHSQEVRSVGSYHYKACWGLFRLQQTLLEACRSSGSLVCLPKSMYEACRGSKSPFWLSQSVLEACIVVWAVLLGNKKACWRPVGVRFLVNKTCWRLVDDLEVRFDYHKTCRGGYGVRLTTGKLVGGLLMFGGSVLSTTKHVWSLQVFI